MFNNSSRFFHLLIMSLPRLGALPMDSPRSRNVFLLVPLLICIFAPASQADIRTVEGIVQKVSDGDTVTLVTHDGAPERGHWGWVVAGRGGTINEIT